MIITHLHLSSKHIVVFNHIFTIRNRISFYQRNTFFNNLISSKFSICITFTKSTIIKECSKINIKVISNISNIIKNILTLLTFIIYIILIKFIHKFLWVRHNILRIYSFYRLTLTFSLLNSSLITFLKLLLKCLLSSFHNLLFKSSISIKYYIRIVSSYNKVMRILKILSYISTYNIRHNIIIT